MKRFFTKCIRQEKDIKKLGLTSKESVDVKPIEVLFDIFDVPIPQKAPEAKIQKRQRGKEGIQRELTLIRKGKDFNFM